MSRPISEIQADLAVAYEGRRKALNVEEYTTDSGQGRSSAKRNLPNINATIRLLEDELEEAQGTSGQTVSVRVDRGPL